MYYHTFNLILMPVYFYKSYKRIIRQRLYINIKYNPVKTHNHILKYIPMETQQHNCTPTP